MHLLVMRHQTTLSQGSFMAGNQVNNNDGGPVDFKSHARDYERMIALLKWGAVAALIVGLLVLIIISN